MKRAFAIMILIVTALSSASCRQVQDVPVPSAPAAKGGEILGKCLSEPRSSEAPEASADNPLVLRLDNN